MSRFVILASVVVIAASSVNCANSREQANGNLLGPSSMAGAGLVGTAAKGGKKPGGGSGSVSFTFTVSDDINGDGFPNQGDTVTFNVPTTVTWNQVNVTCAQNGVEVYGTTASAFYPVVILSSMAWQSGAADCTATLIAFDGSKDAIVGTLAFTAPE